MRLVVDSSCDLPKEITGKYDFLTTPLTVQIGDKVYKDRLDISSKEILEEYYKTKILPKTSALNIADLMSIFKVQLQYYDHIFFMPISSKISSIYNNSILAARELEAEDKITILDSKSLSSGSGLLAVGILEDINNNLSVDEIIDRHNERVKKVNISFVVDTMEFLYKGGRCSGMSYLIGSKFHLHPIIGLEDGKMYVKKLAKGKDITKALNNVRDEFFKDLENNNVDFSYPILFPNVDSNNGVKHLFHELEPKVCETILLPTSASGIICCHCGKNTCGIAYMKKN